MKRNFLGKIAKFFIDQFEMAVLIILLVLSIGTFGFLALPKESLPEIILPTITIRGVYPGASPEDVENLFVDEVESALSSIDAIDKVTSDSNFGVGVIVVNFIEGTDIAFKKLEVDNRLRELKFPEGLTSVESRIFKTSEIPLMNISVSGDKNIFELTAIGEDLEKAIEEIPGVEEVNLYGGLDEEIHIVVNHLKMLEYGVTFRDVQRALQEINVELPIGALDLNGIHYNLKIDETLESVQMIERVLVETVSGNKIFIGDFSQVLLTNEEITEFNQTYTGEKLVPSVFLEVIREAGSDVIGTSEKVKTLLKEKRGVLYPSDIAIDYTNDLSDEVSDDLNNILSSALSGLIVVLLVLYLFIGLKEAMVVSITIPLSLLGTIGVLNFFDITFNAFVVLGLIVSLGLLVDNAIIVMENINRLRLSGYDVKLAADEGTNQVALPILAATLTTLAAFFPLAILPGTLGDFVSTIPITIMITLTMSLGASIIITPAISAKFLKKWKDSVNKDSEAFIKRILRVLIVAGLAYYAFSGNGESLKLSFISAGVFALLAIAKSTSAHTFTENSKWVFFYKKLMTLVLASRWMKVLLLMSGGLLLFISFSLFRIGLVKVAFFPQSEPSGMTINMTVSGGSTLEDTVKIINDAEEVLVSIDEVALFNTRVGGDELNKAIINVAFRTDLPIDGFEVLQRIEKELKLIPGAQSIIRVVSQGPPIGKPVSIKITGEDLEAIKEVANNYKDILENTDGIYNVELSTKTGVPQVMIDVKERKAQLYGLTAKSVADQVRGQIEGIYAIDVRKNREEIKVYIKKSERAIQDKKEIENLYVSTPNGLMLPLGSIAKLYEAEGVSNIKHDEGKRVIFVESDLLPGYNVNDVVKIFNEKRGGQEISKDIQVSVGGDIEGIQESFIDLFQSMILAVFLVFIILTVQFKSVAQPFVILLTVPMAIIGVIWGLAFTGNDFGFYSFMALVALVGIAVNDAIVLIDFTNYLRRQGMGLKESVVEAGVIRFNPVLATTMTTICGVLPLAFKDIYYAQFSFSLVFGLLVTTVLTLVFIPILYSVLEKIKGGSYNEK